MNKFLSGVIAASFVATVGLSAQNNPPAAPPATPGGAGAAAGAQRPAPSAQASASTGKSITVSGCIQSAPAATASAGAGGASASASASKFVLNNAKMAGAASSAVGTSGTANTRYALSGDEKTVSPHLNHQVEITGTLDASSSAASAGAGAPAAAGGSSAAAPPTLKVESVKMVSATCS